MELKIGEYLIPEGYTVKRIGNTLKVYRKKNRTLGEGEFRCKDCKHYVIGHSNLCYWTTTVCDAKPKVLSDAMEKKKKNHKDYRHFKLYFAAITYGKPCDMFELKTK